MVATNHLYVEKCFISIMTLLSPLPENDLSLMKIEKKITFLMAFSGRLPHDVTDRSGKLFFFFRTANLSPRINLKSQIQFSCANIY